MVRCWERMPRLDRLGARMPRMARPAQLAWRASTLAAVLFPLVPGPAAAQMGSTLWDADDRVTITDFQRVTALARSSDRLFAATDGGLVVRSDAFDRWELPVTREDGYPESQVLALAWDRRDRTLWMATRNGRLMQLDMSGRRWVDDVPIGGTVTRIVAAVNDPSVLYVRRGERWFAVDPFSRGVAPVAAAEVRNAIAADFDLRARAELLRDPQFQASRHFLGQRGTRTYEVTDVMPSATMGEFWVATYGGFLELYDSFSGRAEPIDYGVVGIGADAVLASEGEVWFAPRYATDRYGVAASDAELEEWRTWGGESFGFEGDRNAPDDPIHALVRWEDDVWAGGNRGLYRYDGERWHREPLGRQQGDAPITSLAAGPPGLEGVWVGTERGVFRIRSPGSGPDVLSLSASRVRALAASDGALWIGTDAGLVTLRAGEDGRDAVPRATAGGPQGAVGALAAADGRLYVGVERGVWVRGPGAEWTRPTPLGVLGAPVSALAAHDGVVWIGTDEGLLAWETREDRVTPYTFAAGDLPVGPRGERGVADIAVDEDGSVWVATPAGAVRLDIDR